MIDTINHMLSMWIFGY